MLKGLKKITIFLGKYSFFVNHLIYDSNFGTSKTFMIFRILDGFKKILEHNLFKNVSKGPAFFVTDAIPNDSLIQDCVI